VVLGNPSRMLGDQLLLDDKNPQTNNSPKNKNPLNRGGFDVVLGNPSRMLGDQLLLDDKTSRLYNLNTIVIIIIRELQLPYLDWT
jgi:hypothetical protein